MNRKDLYQSMNQIDDDILERSEVRKKKKSSVWMKWGAMAACICLVVGVTIWGMKAVSTENKPSGYVVSEDGITIPAMEVTLSTEDVAMADMMAFFIYEGRCYVQYEHIYEDTGIVGEYLGTATGTIDEWTPKEGYVDFAGSIRGDFYSVNGYAPEFMLCTKDTNGVVSTYICNSGITLKYGKELYEDRLHLSENITGVQYESRSSWYQSMGEVYELDMAEEYIQEFISQLSTEKFLLCQDVVKQEEWRHMVDSEIYHLYFTMSNGTKIHLRLHEKGYVRFQGLINLCVKIPEECYDNLIGVFSQNIGTPVENVQEGM